MAIIKKPIKRTLFYLSSLLGIVFALIAGLVFKNSQYNLSQLENKTKNLFKTNQAQAQSCWTPPPGGGGGNGGGNGGGSCSGGDGDGCDGNNNDGSSCSDGSY